jgi:ubiquinone/menaquinone biosynthesis C-methylase UbiE/uncharacterized membrane protein YbhN (UPF0104 family)
METTRARPRALLYLLVAAAALAVALTGLASTGLVLGRTLRGAPVAVPAAFWLWLAAGCVLTTGSLFLRALRWAFLLRRSDVRIPLRDACIGYFAGFSLVLAPFLIGEIAVRAHVLARRQRVPAATTAVVNIWERWLDVLAVATIYGLCELTVSPRAGLAALVASALALSGPLRRWSLYAAEAAVGRVARWLRVEHFGDLRRISGTGVTTVAFLVGVAAWVLPGVAFWGLVRSLGPSFSMLDAGAVYAGSSLAGAVVLTPGGVLVTGGRMLDALGAIAMPAAAAAMAVAGIRLVTVGLSTALGWIFLFVHTRTPAADTLHFDEIASAYDLQIPEALRLSLLDRKTSMMRDVLVRHGVGSRGLDVGCGHGWYVARMREMGFDVTGIDASPGQVARAVVNVGDSRLVGVGSALEIPAAEETYDFVYTINVLHHLASVDEQRRAFLELSRVLKPGGLLFVHEANTRNLLFRFYLGYVFPAINCIDEGVERWLLPNRLNEYTDLPVVERRYFTFLPDFLPTSVGRVCAPLERALEASPLAVYSAHYMAALRKPA